jgi:hypothetical protein
MGRSVAVILARVPCKKDGARRDSAAIGEEKKFFTADGCQVLFHESFPWPGQLRVGGMGVEGLRSDRSAEDERDDPGESARLGRSIGVAGKPGFFGPFNLGDAAVMHHQLDQAVAEVFDLGPNQREPFGIGAG